VNTGPQPPADTKADVTPTPADVIPAEAWIHTAFELILSRSPSPAEIKLCIEFLKSEDSEANRQSLVRALLNHNDFVTIR
jgi:Fic family protein